MLFTNERKKIVSLIQILRVLTCIILLVSPFLRGCGICHLSLGTSSDKTYLHTENSFKIP